MGEQALAGLFCELQALNETEAEGHVRRAPFRSASMVSAASTPPCQGGRAGSNPATRSGPLPHGSLDAVDQPGLDRHPVKVEAAGSNPVGIALSHELLGGIAQLARAAGS